MRNLITLLALCFYSLISAQNVGIGTTSPDPSAALDIVDTNRGILIPRTDTANISSPALGLLIFQNSDNKFYYHNGNKWSIIGGTPTSEDKIIDSDNDTRILVEEYPDEDRLRFYAKGELVLQMFGKKVEFMNNGNSLFLGQFAGASDDLSTNRNTFVGYRAGKSNTTGENNVALGNQALDKVTVGSNNIAIGKQSMFDNTGSNNIAIGLNASQKNTTGTKNIAIGNNANFNNATGNENLAIGDEAGKGLLTSNISNNIFIGNRSGKSIQGSDNLAIGRDALSYGDIVGVRNIAIGDSSLHDIGSRTDNVAIGYKAGKNLQGYHNTIVGSLAGGSNSGDRNSFFGYKAGNKANLGLNNSFFGHSTGEENTTGKFNSYFGAFSGQANQVENLNSFFGYQSGQNNLACCNSFFGASAGNSNTDGGGNTFVGSEAGEGNITGSDNVYVGNAAGKISNSSNSTVVGVLSGYANEGENNSFIGYQSGFANTTGENNSYLGYYAGLSNLIGSDNTQVGHMAGLDNEANDNIFVGSEAARWNKLGANTIAIGNRTAYRDTATTNSIYLGYEAGYVNSQTNRTGNVFIGYRAGYDKYENNRLIIENSNSTTPLIYGKFDEDILTINGNVGIGEENPSEKLHVIGNIVASGNISSISDKRFKKNLSIISNPLNKLNNINGYYYNWKIEEFPSKEFSDDRQLGFIAQEVEAIFPEMVLTGSDGYKSIDYARLTPVLLEAIKTLNIKLEDQEQLINSQSTSINEINNRLKMIEESLIKAED